MRVIAATLLGLMALPAVADGPVVVELFTSQGCSSCPPADEMLHDLASKDGVIPLALHVDYWDYLGWRDTFASAAFTARQHAYAHAVGDRTVYTPQFIIGGQDRVVGANAMSVMDQIRAHEREDSPVTLDVARSGGGLRVEARSTEGRAMVVQLVRYRPEAPVEILRGENRGRTLTYTNIVTDWDIVAQWNGRGDLALDLPLEGAQPAVVIVQDAGNGPIRAAARVN